MKRIVYLGIANLIAFAAFAQNSNVNKAEYRRQEGELAEAKELIDLAAVHEKSLDKARTWYVRGLIYGEIASSDNEATRALDPGAAAKMTGSLKKLEELEGEQGKNYSLLNLQIGTFRDMIYNRGVTEYQSEAYMDAFNSFRTLTEIAPKDTVGYMFAGICAEQLEDYDLAKDMYLKAKGLENCPVTVYNQLIVIEDIHNEDPEAALAFAKEASERFPGDDSFANLMINLYLKTGKTEEARIALAEAVEKDPGNANNWYNLGYLYGEVGDFENSVASYAKATEVDPDYSNAYINLAFTYTEKAKKVLEPTLEMDINTYQREAQKYIDEANVYYEKAVPALERAHELNPEEMSILEALGGVYSRLKMNDKYQEVLKKLEDSGGD